MPFYTRLAAAVLLPSALLGIKLYFLIPDMTRIELVTWTQEEARAEDVLATKFCLWFSSGQSGGGGGARMVMVISH